MTREEREFTKVKIQFMEACSDALKVADVKPPLLAAQLIWAIPSDLASHGFEVAMLQQESGEWWIEVQREIGDGVFTVQAKGRSLLEALRALSGSAATVFDSWQFGESVEIAEAA